MRAPTPVEGPREGSSQGAPHNDFSNLCLTTGPEPLHFAVACALAGDSPTRRRLSWLRAERLLYPSASSRDSWGA